MQANLAYAKNGFSEDYVILMFLVRMWKQLSNSKLSIVESIVARILRFFDLCSLERSCRSPTVELPSLSSNITSSLTVRRANQLVIYSKVSLDCELLYETIFNWEVYDLHSQSRGHPFLSRYGGSSEFLIKRGKLPMGIYLVRLTVKMAGTQVYGLSEGYIRVIESPLVAHISGGTKVERGFNKSLVFNASFSRDPDSFTPPYGEMTTLL